MNPSSNAQPKIAEMYPGIYQPDGKTLGEGGPDLPMQPLNTLLGFCAPRRCGNRAEGGAPTPFFVGAAPSRRCPLPITPPLHTPHAPPAGANSRADLAISGY